MLHFLSFCLCALIVEAIIVPKNDCIKDLPINAIHCHYLKSWDAYEQMTTIFRIKLLLDWEMRQPK